MASESRSVTTGGSDVKVPRIDPAHGGVAVIPSAPLLVPADMIRAAAGRTAGAACEQVRDQAEQLASHLQKGQADLDRRVAEFHARVAKWEAERRADRVWLAERQAELDERDSELQTRARQLAAQEERLDARHRALEEKDGEEAELAERLSRVADRERSLQEELKVVARQSAWLNAAQAQWARTEGEPGEPVVHPGPSNSGTGTESPAAGGLKRQGPPVHSSPAPSSGSRPDERGAARTEEMAELREIADRLLGELQEVAELADRLRVQQSESAAREARRRQSLGQAWRRKLQRYHTQLDQLRLRRDQADAREESLSAVRDELASGQRQALRRRYLTGRVRSLLERAAPSDELYFALLAEHKQFQETVIQMDRVTEQREREVRCVAERLENQQQDLQARRERLQAWFDRRYHELEAQAARLIARETELDRRDRHQMPAAADRMGTVESRLRAIIATLEALQQ